MLPFERKMWLFFFPTEKVKEVVGYSRFDQIRCLSIHGKRLACKRICTYPSCKKDKRSSFIGRRMHKIWWRCGKCSFISIGCWILQHIVCVLAHQRWIMGQLGSNVSVNFQCFGVGKIFCMVEKGTCSCLCFLFLAYSYKHILLQSGLPLNRI